MPPLVVAREGILELKGDAYAQLVRDGVCEWSYPEEPATQSTGRKQTLPGVTDPCLALDKSRGNFWFEFEPEADLHLLLDWSCLTTYDIATRRLRRTGAASLREELAQRMNANGSVSSRTSVDTSAGTSPAVAPRPFTPGMWRADGYGNYIRDAAVETWQRTGTFFGQLAICGCGVAGCSATYAWLTGDTGLLLVEIVAAGVVRVEIGPFPIA
jgi:hypothetical protein